VPSERNVAGLWCGDVLAALSEYLDGSLPFSRRAAIEDHLQGCDVCQRFGHEFSETVAMLRRQLADAERLPEDVGSRLRERLRKA
jgi:anti-sigma factor RsiW